MSDNNELHELVDRHLRGELDEAEKERLVELLDSDADARRDFVAQAQWDTRVADVLRAGCPSCQTLLEPNADADADADAPLAAQRPAVTLNRALWAAAAAIIFALTAGLYFQPSSAERPIATITGLSGSLQWTGGGGRVFHDLSVGAELSGGTIEGMEPGSWFELEFNDGSTVTISGNVTLTFSDHGQKKLHLKEGGVSGNVKPQPAGKPMLIHTRTARLEVLGTQFDIDAGVLVTTLNVSEGTVRVKRLSDGSTVDVPAKHRVIAAADRKLLPVPVPDSVNRWVSQLHLGPRATQGTWSPKADTRSARLRAIPYTSSAGITIYTAGLVPSLGDKPSVIVQSASRLKVRGRLASTHKVYFGVTVRRPNGQFAGRFQTTRPAEEFRGGQDFEVILKFRDFQLDPSLLNMKSRLAGAPFDLDVDAFWFHTLDKQAGLEITEVELIPPTEGE
jgi:ferric-dicitrate binding protein FerR (iron transport regulator)